MGKYVDILKRQKRVDISILVMGDASDVTEYD